MIHVTDQVMIKPGGYRKPGSLILCSFNHPGFRYQFKENAANINKYCLSKTEAEDNSQQGGHISLTYFIEGARGTAAGKHHADAKDTARNQHMYTKGGRMKGAHMDGFKYCLYYAEKHQGH